MTSPQELGTEIETFFDEVLPDVLDGVGGASDASTVARAKAWRAALFDHGLAALDYPTAVGGRGLDGDHLDVWREASRGRMRAGVSRNRSALRLSTTSASISGYSNGKLRLKTSSARRFTAMKPEVGSVMRWPRIGRSTQQKIRPPNRRGS